MSRNNNPHHAKIVVKLPLNTENNDALRSYIISCAYHTFNYSQYITFKYESRGGGIIWEGATPKEVVLFKSIVQAAVEKHRGLTKAKGR